MFCSIVVLSRFLVVFPCSYNVLNVIYVVSTAEVNESNKYICTYVFESINNTKFAKLQGRTIFYQYFATTLCNFTTFKMNYPDVVIVSTATNVHFGQPSLFLPQRIIHPDEGHIV